MSTLTPDNRKTEFVYQPHLIRYHHAYRSPMNSQRLNLQQNSLAYDIMKLNQKMITFESKLDTQMTNWFDNSTTLIGYTMTWWDTTTVNPPSYSNVEDISVILNGYLKRLKTLEQYK